MTTPMPIREDSELSCRVLSELIGQQSDIEMQRLMLQDFASKSVFLRPEAKWYYLSNALVPLMLPDLRDVLKGVISMTPSPKPRADIVIITIKKPELIAAKLAFGIPLNRKENIELNGLRYWETGCLSHDGTEDLRVVITMVGEERTAPCIVACDRLFNTYDVGSCLLVGISAGLKEKVKLSDVVCADLIIDYEGQRLEPDGPKKRPVPYSPEVAILRDLQHFSPSYEEWHRRWKECIQNLPKDPKPMLVEDSIAPDFHLGVILTGEKLLANGALPEMRKEYHDRVMAGEMEGSGFARACREYSKPWLVFRGISDYGDPDKPATEDFQVVAALAAATVAKLFIETEYRKRSEKEF